MKDVWNFLSNRHITAEMDEIEVINARITNQYAFILSFVAVLHAFFDFFLLNTPHFYVVGCIGLYMFLTTLLTRIRFMRFYPLVFSICLSSAIFYYASANGFDNGISLYFIVFLAATPIATYDSVYKYRFIPVIFVLVGILFLFSSYYDFHIFPNGGAFVDSKYLRYIIIFNALLFSALNTYFIISKQQMILSQYNKIKGAEMLITNMKNKLAALDNAVVISTDIPSIEEVIRMAMDGNIAFVPSFRLLFPNMHAQLLSINPNMTPDEFRFCALLKLDFSTKDISVYDNVTVRSVQARKNRLRKSFNIASETDLYNWIESV